MTSATPSTPPSHSTPVASEHSPLLWLLRDLLAQMASMRQWRDMTDARLLGMDGRLLALDTRMDTLRMTIPTPGSSSPSPSSVAPPGTSTAAPAHTSWVARVSTVWARLLMGWGKVRGIASDAVLASRILSAMWKAWRTLSLGSLGYAVLKWLGLL